MYTYLIIKIKTKMSKSLCFLVMLFNMVGLEDTIPLKLLKKFVCIHSNENTVFHYVSTEDYHGGLIDMLNEENKGDDSYHVLKSNIEN